MEEWGMEPKGDDGPEILQICVRACLGEGDGGEYYTVGSGSVTKIEATFKSGELSYIPYVRVWKDGAPYAEFCQHRIVGVYFTKQ